MNPKSSGIPPFCNFSSDDIDASGIEKVCDVNRLKAKSMIVTSDSALTFLEVLNYLQN